MKSDWIVALGVIRGEIWGVFNLHFIIRMREEALESIECVFENQGILKPQAPVWEDSLGAIQLVH